MKKTILAYEITTNTQDIPSIGEIRILAADKIRMEMHHRSHGWDLEDGPRAVSLMLFFALSRTGVISGMDFDEFVENTLIDYAAADETAENPTR